MKQEPKAPKTRTVKQKYNFWTWFFRILVSPVYIILIVIGALILCFKNIGNYFKYGSDTTIFDKEVNKTYLRDVFLQNQEILKKLNEKGNNQKQKK